MTQRVPPSSDGTSAWGERGVIVAVIAAILVGIPALIYLDEQFHTFVDDLLESSPRWVQSLLLVAGVFALIVRFFSWFDRAVPEIDADKPEKVSAKDDEAT
ncbi:hypothetical protein [Usitatibacter rugosus]|uniref:hypothetical protein n=1 Tax=Usitatibacter rugosus TaxID=2732067 RepID=UPI0014889117|nr:hypothetical protein [Usitatibacter rugosus]